MASFSLMAKPSFLLLAVFLLFLMVDMAILNIGPETVMAEDGYGCQGKCTYRCSLNHEKHGLCVRTCNTCCGRCHGCVPVGPTASRDACACYGQMKTHGGRYKCP